MRAVVVTALVVAATTAIVGVARSAALAQFTPALAAGVVEAPRVTADPLSVADRTDDRSVARSRLPAETPSPAPAPETVESGPAAPVSVAPRPVSVSSRTPTPTTPPAVAVAQAAPATAAPVVAQCAASWFCYPRLGIAGTVVPYTDCSGSTDVGTQIRSFACLSDHYLMAHAYTQFGRITGWQAGDVVIVYGTRYTVTGAFVQSACTQPRLPLAPLSMQTSLTANACGNVLVVQAR